MKACIIQPDYSVDHSQSESYFLKQLELMDQCDPSIDLIVMPEACDVPCRAKTLDQWLSSYAQFTDRLLEKASNTAKRCNAILCVNAISFQDTGRRNTTYIFDRNGSIVGQYFKRHLTPGEMGLMQLDTSYTLRFTEPYILELEGLRFAFLTCYDWYFYEAFARIARERPDIIIGCSHQRSDSHRALELFTSFCAYNTNSYVVRASVSMGSDSTLGGSSMIVAPDGTILANMKSEVGLCSVEFDPKKKYFKPMGFGNSDGSHFDYIEQGRRPWQYRPGGSAIVCRDKWMKYPRVCAHRGYHDVLPENSLPAIGAAIALGAEEVEFDVRSTKDGVLVLWHDNDLSQIIGGSGTVEEHTFAELLTLDFGNGVPGLSNLPITTLEEVLKKYSCHCVMNVHLKTAAGGSGWKKEHIHTLDKLIKRYDCAMNVYLMSGDEVLLQQLQELVPEYPRCAGAGKEKDKIVEKAIKYGCSKVQFFHGYCTKEMIARARENGIRCNYFYSDDTEEIRHLIASGIDTVLTNVPFSALKAIQELKQES